MIDTSKFEGIRPYVNKEIPSAMNRIPESELFPLIAFYIFLKGNIEDVRRHIRGIATEDQFQDRVISIVNEQVIKRSMTPFSYNGIDRLENKKYLFVSNPRDIMLDLRLLQCILHINRLETSEITFGAILMCHPLVIDIGKSNKMYRIKRGGNPRDFYQSYILNSDNIRYTITEKNYSVWIAQLYGRTTDGIDHTEPELIRMFGSSLPSDKLKALSELNIVPISASYEWETCDILKAFELFEVRFTKYVKKPVEDLNSFLTCIIAAKGHVHFEICEPISIYELQMLDSMTKHEYLKTVASIIDKRINSSYNLHPNIYIAFDIKCGTKRYADRYTLKQTEAFCERLNILSTYEGCELDVLTNISWYIYKSN